MSSKQRLILGLIVGLSLIGAYIALKPKPKRMTALSVRALPAMPNLSKIEIQTATSSTGKEGMGDYSGPLMPNALRAPRITLERRETQWWITSPIEAPASKRYTDRIQSVLSQAHGTDKIPVEQGKLTAQGLDDASRTIVTFHQSTPGSSPITLHVGKEVVIPPLNVRRTFVQWPEDSKVYRLQSTLGFLRHRTPLSMRSMHMAKFKPQDVKRLRFDTPNRPEEASIVLERAGEGWRFIEPKMSVGADTGTINFVLSALSPLSASGMLQDTTATKFKPQAQTILSVTTKGEDTPSMVLHMRKVQKDPEQTSWYEATLDQREEVFRMTRQRGVQLTPDMSRLRDLRVNPFDSTTITRFAVHDRTRTHLLTFKKTDGTWRMVAPVQAPVASSSSIDAMVNALATMKVGRYAKPSERALLGDKPQRIELEGPEGTHVLLIGDPTPGSQEVFVSKYKDVEPAFVVTTYMMRSFLPKIQSVVSKDVAEKILKTNMK